MPIPQPILRRADSETHGKNVRFSDNSKIITVMSEEEYDRTSVPISRLYYKDYCELRMMRMQMIQGAYKFEV